MDIGKFRSALLFVFFGACATLIAPVASGQRFNCADGDQYGACLSLGVKNDKTFVTSITGFDSASTYQLTPTKGAKPLLSMISQSDSGKKIWSLLLSSSWTVELQKKVEGANFVQRITLCSDDGVNVSVKDTSTTYPFVDPSSLTPWGATYTQKDGATQADAHIVYYGGRKCGETTGSGQTLNCNSSHCWVVFSSKDLTTINAQNDANDSMMPLEGGSVDLWTEVQPQLLKKNHVALVEGKVGDRPYYVSHITAENVKDGIDISIPLKGQTWTLDVRLKDGKRAFISGISGGTKILFTAPTPLEKLGYSDDGYGVRFAGDAIQSVTLRIGGSRLPLEYSYIGTPLIIHYHKP